MLNCVLLLSVLSVTGISKTESRKTAKDICKNRCLCEEKENLLNINCENKGFTTVSLLQPPQTRVYQLFLNGNLLTRLFPNEFANYSNAVTLHLGNNELQDIITGAFNGLKTLKRLHLNNNNLEIIREDTFLGLESVEYLQADYNYIRIIEAGAFSKLNKLKVLILNDNLIATLPNNVFRFVLLTHLDLRGNRLKMLPFAGVLEHIGGIMEIQLEENPWNCTCELLPLKAWLDTISVFVGEIVCETPFRLHGKDVTQLTRQDLCPRKSTSDWNQREKNPSQSETHFRGLLPTVNTAVVPSRASKATRPPKIRNRPTPRVMVSKDRQMMGTIMIYQGKSSVPISCPSSCMCTSQNPDSGLNVNCQERRINNISDLYPKPSNPKELYFTGNYLQIVFRNDLKDFNSLDLLHLGNNRIVVIQEGAFSHLRRLRRLYLNGNYIENIYPSMFDGLQSLQYLNLEYNIIKEIQPHAFDSLGNLELLFLNNNLLKSLPDDVFRGLALTRLNLKNNHFPYLPVRGVLDQLLDFIQIDIRENPWECTCDILALKNWIEQSSASVMVDEITCDSPSKHAGKLLLSLRNDAICPENPNMITPAVSVLFYNSNTPYSLSVSPSLYPQEHTEVPLSVLILGLLIVFILSVCFGAGLFVFVLKRSKGVQSVPSSADNLDLNSFQLQYESYNTEIPDKTEGHVYNYIPPSVGQMCQNPIYMQKDPEVAYYRNLHDLGYSCVDHNKKESQTSPAYTITTVELPQKQSTTKDPELLYQNIPESVKELPSEGVLHYNFCTLPKRQFPLDSGCQNQDRLNKNVLYGTPRKHFAEQSNSEQPLLHEKLQTEPDYLEVLEKQTTVKQL
ncbi:SLIT and NTRK-like protein 2 [Latimeria chalumnae]|uniref:SLIT and NTRK-like protein 2 n=1 Tax=Latimeria chalumnae TaxID=7897 RepID=UPI0003C1A1EE|nr:PREDICTED: SLIT and NTRK-like protein 2 [Latimeria chalumnae]|eukprot:XP_005990385.1 PREDICTED: SLIT and NTRK-like protein 2 [Latimeria chalumnae]